MAPSLGDQTAQQEPQQIPQQTANMVSTHQLDQTALTNSSETSTPPLMQFSTPPSCLSRSSSSYR